MLIEKREVVLTQEELRAFCGTDDDRAWMHQPWSRCDYTYATNGKILIRVPRLADVEDGNYSKSCDNLVRPHDTAEWLPMPVVDMPEPETCSACEGRKADMRCDEREGCGKLTLSSNKHDYDVDCISCGGSGRLPTCPTCHGTGQVMPIDIVHVGEAAFQTRYLALFSRLPCCEIAATGPESVAAIRFTGGVGAIMPFRVGGRSSP
jgi:hypothetical protein